jgi:heme-degrading monooxygenase HmoA
MFARVSRYEVPAERIGDAAAAFSQAIDQIREMTGLTEAYLLTSTEDGRVLTMTLWENRAAMEASGVSASRLRSEAAGSLGASVVSTEQYEVEAHEGG